MFFGPRHANSAAAQALLEAGLAFEIEDAGDLGLKLLPLLHEPSRAEDLGRRARERIERMAGAAELCFKAVQQALAESRA